MKEKHNPIQLDPKKFSTIIDGKEVSLYTLENERGMKVSIMNLGAKVVSLVVPDKQGNPTDVVLGHDSVEDYINSEEQYFGAICGRYANRIAKGKFSIDGEDYELAVNNGPNALHGGLKGFNAQVWDVIESDSSHLTLRYTSADGEEGYPGELITRVTYTLSEDNELRLDYEARTSKPTVLNLTNHSYFNLSGEGNPSVHDHYLTINASTYLPTDDTAIPYGPAEAVKGTPFDFTTPHTIGERVDEKIDQLTWARGYDHTYIIDKPLGEYGLCCTCHAPETGITMTIHTTEPGVQVYTGNWMSGNMRGKGESRYPARAAVCFETQHYPDSPNRPEYPSTLLRPGSTHQSTTTFAFTVE